MNNDDKKNSAASIITIGMTGFLLALIHALISFMLFSPSVYGKFFVEDGTLTMLGGLSMLSGVIAFVILWGYNMSFQTFLREDKAFIQNGPVYVGKS